MRVPNNAGHACKAAPDLSSPQANWGGGPRPPARLFGEIASVRDSIIIVASYTIEQERKEIVWNINDTKHHVTSLPHRAQYVGIILLSNHLEAGVSCFALVSLFIADGLVISQEWLR